MLRRPRDSQRNRAMFERFQSGDKNSVIAKDFGLSRPSVRKICLRQLIEGPDKDEDSVDARRHREHEILQGWRSGMSLKQLAHKYEGSVPGMHFTIKRALDREVISA